MSWHEKIVKEMGIRHSDTFAVIRWGKLAKRGTQRMLRRKGKAEVRKEETDALDP